MLNSSPGDNRFEKKLTSPSAQVSRYLDLLQATEVSSTTGSPVISFYSSRKRNSHEQIVTNGRMAKKNKSPPEVICLSDDDDDITDNTPVATPIKQQPSPAASVNGSNNKTDNFQPSDWTVQRKDIIRIPDLPSKYSDIHKKSVELRCSAIRFGLVEFNVENEIVFMRETEFEMKLKGGALDNLNIKLAYSDVITFYYSFQSQPPAAFIQVRTEFADLFQKYIPSSDEFGKEFDPNSKDQKRRRIVFCLKSLSADMEKLQISIIYHFLKSKSSKMNVCCVTGSRGQELYNLSRFARVTALGSTSAPFVLTSTDLTPKTVGLNKNQIRFDLSRDDLCCLNEGEFLNDNIIDFYLQYIYYELLSEEDRKRTYLFNSFFYTRLTRKGNDDNPNVSAAERRYNRVKRWLRDVDIFSKDYLIVPINQTAHWYIVLIRFHNNVPTEADLMSDDDEEEQHGSGGDEIKISSNASPPANHRLKSKKKKLFDRVLQPSVDSNDRLSSLSASTLPAIEALDEADEAIADNDITLSNNQITTIDESIASPMNRLQSPSIVLFDSLRVGSKNRVAATLREFLQLEYDHKKTLPATSFARKLFNVDTIPAIDAAVPQQPNYFDCGLYVLQYIESFFAQHLSTINFHSSTTLATWCEKNSMGSSKRKQILNVINQHVINKDE